MTYSDCSELSAECLQAAIGNNRAAGEGRDAAERYIRHVSLPSEYVAELFMVYASTHGRTDALVAHLQRAVAHGSSGSTGPRSSTDQQQAARLSHSDGVHSRASARSPTLERMQVMSSGSNAWLVL